MPADDFRWIGYDGSPITAHRAADHYLSAHGQAAAKVTQWIRRHPDQPVGLVLWGVGDHGGGPSHVDLDDLQKLRGAPSGYDIRHSTPEAYFSRPSTRRSDCLRCIMVISTPGPPAAIPRRSASNKPSRLLENELFSAEKMLAAAALNGRLAYPHQELAQAQRDLLLAEFHDILPGSSIQPVEEETRCD